MAFALVSRAAQRMAALALPPRCAGCGEPVGADHSFCAPCWDGMRFLGPPWCAGCQTPLPYAAASMRCGLCLADPPRHAGVRAAVGYGAVARRLALRLKYGGRMGVATTMARLIAGQVPAAVDLLVPVPLHRWRLWRRGYNQALLITEALGRQCGIAIARHALRRRHATAPLRGMGRRERRAALRGAFVVADPAAVAGRTVGLVDDVYTSGATTDACTRVLLAAGARSVTVLCWARVVPGDDGAGRGEGPP